MFENGFPKEMRNDVQYVCSKISLNTYNNVRIGESEQILRYLLSDNQEITFPYRLYYVDDSSCQKSSFTLNQKRIYHCVFSRSCDGFIREKHIKALLSEEQPEWVIPYILKVCDEYVAEILELVYSCLKDKDTGEYKIICQKNLQQFLYSHDRMISYWNEFYRGRCSSYRQYVGYRLFKECFGYTRSMEKAGRSREYVWHIMGQSQY